MNFKNFLNLPETEKGGVIKKIYDKKNPITIKIDDGTSNGTKILLSPYEYRRYNKNNKLKVGNKIKVYLQKHPMDNGSGPFQISKVEFI